MNKIWTKIAYWIYSYGEKHAGMKSVRGSFEHSVPEKLRWK